MIDVRNNKELELEIKKMRVKKYQEEYRNKPENKERRKELNKLWRQAHPEYHKEYYLNKKRNRDAINSNPETKLILSRKQMNNVLGFSWLVIVSQVIIILVISL